jgi:molybdenum cofactor synthesis domain-containing protein
MRASHHDPSAEVALAEWIALLGSVGATEPTPGEAVALADALGRVAAEDVVALHPSPPHRCAAMDGIAVQAAETAFAPVVLQAGEYETIDTGQCVATPWDAVVPVEETAPDPGGVLVRHVVLPGAHVRPAGEDVDAGAVVVEAGTRLGPYDLALAAACGHAALAVRAAVRVAIIPTGDELRPAGTMPRQGELADSNSIMLSARLREEGSRPDVLPVVRDDPDALVAAVRAAADAYRVVLVLAGSSKGTRDHTARVLDRCGTLAVRGVALRPAHPVLLGAVGSSAVVGVPGYPVSAALTMERFVLPLVDRLTARRRHAVTMRVRVASELLPRRDAEVVVPLALEPGADGIPRGVPQSRKGGALAGLARAGALLRLPAGGDVVAAGTVVEAEALASARP